MATQTQLLDLPCGKGLAEGVDARLLGPGNVAQALNLVCDRSGRSVRRYGFVALPDELSAGVAMDAPVRFCTVRDELLAIGRSTNLCVLQTHCPNWGYWQDTDSVPHFAVTRTPLMRNFVHGVGALLVPFGKSGKSYELAVLASSDTAGTYTFEYNVTDATTGAVVLREVTILANYGYAVISATTCAGDAIVIYQDSSGGSQRLRELKIDGAALTSATTTLVTTAAAAGFLADTYAITTSTYLIAYVDLAVATSAVLVEVNSSSAITKTATVGLVLTTSGIRVAGVSAGKIYVATRMATDDVLAFSRNHDATLTANFGVTIIEAAPNSTDDLGVEVDRAGAAVVVWGGNIVANEGGVFCRSLSTAGAVGVTRRNLYRAALGSSPRLIDGNVYAVVLLEQNGSNGATYAVVCLDDSSSYQPLTLVATLQRNLAAVGLLGSAFKILQTARLSWVVGLPILFKSEKWTSFVLSVTAADRFEIEAIPTIADTAALWQPVLVSNLLCLSGAANAYYDGNAVCELGFLQPPRIIGHTVNAGTAGPPAAAAPGNAYAYLARYEALDDQGNLHVSPWSNVHTATLVAPPDSLTLNTITLTLLNTSATRRDRYGRNRDVLITVWRTTANGVAASGEGIFYRMTPYGDPILTAAATPRNSKIAYSQTFADTRTDAVLLALGLGQYVSSGDVLESASVPPSLALCTHRGRLWLASAEDDKELWFSKLLVREEPPGFNPALTLRLDDSAAGITALASLDDKLVIFTEAGLYCVTGEGPNDTGNGGTFNGPYGVVSPFGCIDARSVVVTPAGLFFQSSEGLCLLDRALSVTFPGEAVRETTAQWSRCQGVVHDARRSRVIWLMLAGSAYTQNSRFIVYDYLHQVWSVWKSDAFSDASQIPTHTIWQDRHVISFASDGDPYIEATSADGKRGWDDIDGGHTAISTVHETPWVRAGSIAGFALARVLHIVGVRSSYCNLQVEEFVDYNDVTPVNTVTFALTSSGSSIEDADRPHLEYELERKQGKAWKFRLTETPEAVGGGGWGSYPAGADEGRGLRLVSLMLEIGVESGVAKVAAVNQKG